MMSESQSLIQMKRDHPWNLTIGGRETVMRWNAYDGVDRTLVSDGSFNHAEFSGRSHLSYFIRSTSLSDDLVAECHAFSSNEGEDQIWSKDLSPAQ
jgi:hypothetical protein